MAKIKLKGAQEYIEISDYEAKKIKEVWLDNEIDNEQKISVGKINCEKGDIKNILFDENKTNANDDFNQQILKYQQESDIQAARSAKEKAIDSWSMFSLFYYGHFYQKPDEQKYRDLVTLSCYDFFKQNPLWARPNPLIFFEFIHKKETCDSFVSRLFENVFYSERAEVERRKKEQKVQKEIENLNGRN